MTVPFFARCRNGDFLVLLYLCYGIFKAIVIL